MRKTAKRFLGRRLGIGRIGLPLWTLALAALVLAVAGQALGPVLSGMVTGSAGVVVERSIRIDRDFSDVYSNFGADDATLTVSDEGDSFTAALEMHVGALDNLLILVIENTSGATVNAELTLNLPAGLMADIDSFGIDVIEAKLDNNTWLLTLTEDSEDEDLDITLVMKDDAAPGFYTVTGMLRQTSG